MWRSLIYVCLECEKRLEEERERERKKRFSLITHSISSKSGSANPMDEICLSLEYCVCNVCSRLFCLYIYFISLCFHFLFCLFFFSVLCVACVAAATRERAMPCIWPPGGCARRYGDCAHPLPEQTNQSSDTETTMRDPRGKCV